MEAVGVGYVFNLFDEGDLPGVDLRETGEYVRVDGSLYPLMKAATYEQSRMVDAALDIRGERRVDDFRWEEPRLPDGRGALAALLGGDDFYNPGAGIYLDSYLNDREPELIVRRCSLDGFERLVGRMRDDGEDYRDGAVAPFEAAEKASDGDESIPLDEVGGLRKIMASEKTIDRAAIRAASEIKPVPNPRQGDESARARIRAQGQEPARRTRIGRRAQEEVRRHRRQACQGNDADEGTGDRARTR